MKESEARRNQEAFPDAATVFLCRPKRLRQPYIRRDLVLPEMVSERVRVLVYHSCV